MTAPPLHEDNHTQQATLPMHDDGSLFLNHRVFSGHFRLLCLFPGYIVHFNPLACSTSVAVFGLYHPFSAPVSYFSSLLPIIHSNHPFFIAVGYHLFYIFPTTCSNFTDLFFSPFCITHFAVFSVLVVHVASCRIHITSNHQ